jgi:superfamily II DNA/RNA helicase
MRTATLWRARQRFTMSCNSTYLLDHETDHGVKADELATLVAELFEEASAKVVIFSQWVRTLELIVRRLEANGWGYVLFHGGIPSEKRPALVDRFREDPSCRVFLSTDAGGVGLNLQHAAATIINMDLPWNPAVLEQRIGRVHRLGQTKSVQVVNFVAQGTIEEGMLSVLAFKKSLFAGVLDGGENEIFLQGTHLSKFMESVDQVTGAMGKAETIENTVAVAAEAKSEAAHGALEADLQRDEESVAADHSPPQPSDGAAGASPAPDPWAKLIDAGLKLIEGVVAARGEDETERSAASSPRIETDPRTGKSYLKLPIPEPETVHRLAGALSGLLAALRR